MSTASQVARELNERNLGSVRLETGRVRLERWGTELVGWNCTEGRNATAEELAAAQAHLGVEA